MAFTWPSFFRITLLLLLVFSIIVACFTLPIEKILKNFLLWVDHDLGPWGPFVLAVAYIPLTILAVPASVLTLGGGYLFGLPVGFIADSLGATIGAAAAFLLGRTVGRSFVISKLKDYPQFRAVAIAIQRSGFKILKNFLLWVDHDLGPWGPLVLAVAYIPLTILAVPASVLTLGGGYLFGLPVGFIADSLGATIGAAAAFLLGRTVGRSFVISKLKDYPQFRAVAIAIQRSGFKIVLLLRLVPLLPFNVLNYLLSVTPVSIGEYALASWIGMMPITLALVYVGTTLKSLSDVTHGWGEFSTSRWVLLIASLVVSVILMVCVTKVAKNALEKALAENDHASGMLPVLATDLNCPLIIKIDPPEGTHEK